MTVKRLTTVISVVVALSGISLFAADAKPAQQAPAAAKAAQAPRLTVINPLIDFGTVPKGQKLDAVFEIKNTGTADLHVIGAQPSCGCTIAEYDKVIKAGATGKVKAVVNTKDFAGPISKSVTLKTNDPDTPTSQLNMHAVVKPYVEAYPAGFVRYNLVQGDVSTQSVTIYSEEEEPFQITEILTPGDHVKATFRKIEKAEERARAGRPDQAQYKLDITLGGPTAPIGPLAEKLTIKTNSKHQPEYQISLTGVVRPTYTVSPNVVNFGEVATAEETAATRTVMIKSNIKENPGELKVTKVDSSDPKLMVGEFSPTETPGVYQVKVKLAKDAKPGPFNAILTIHTNDKVKDVHTLTVKGAVKAPTE